MSIGERIALLRKQRGMTQEQLAEKLGTTRQAVSKWESGKTNPDIDYIIAMSAFFGVTTDYLLLGKSPQVENRDSQSSSSSPSSDNNKNIKIFYVVFLVSGIFLLLLTPLFATLYRNYTFDACGSAYTNAYLYLGEWPILGIVLLGVSAVAVGIGGVITRLLNRKHKHFCD